MRPDFLEQIPSDEEIGTGGHWMHCMKLLGQRLSARDFDWLVAQIQI